MPNVLVVDDSSVDRRMVAGILEPDREIIVDFASDGAEALERMEVSLPDAVVTDLVMPKINGLELVKVIRSRYAAVPVILMTSQGNEELAAEALACGAASYVPKNALLLDLRETLQHVLALSTQLRGESRLMDGLSHSRTVFELPNESTLISSLVGHLQHSALSMGICDEAERIRFGMALEEALDNAMYHGNLEVDSCLKETDSCAFDAMVQSRRSQPPYCERTIRVRVDLSPVKAVITVADQGPGFDPDSLPDPTDLENLDRISGRGVLLMRTFMDEVQYSETGSQVTLTKLRKAGGDG